MKSLNQDWVERFLHKVSKGLCLLHLVLSVMYIEDKIMPMFIASIIGFLAAYVSLQLIKRDMFRAYTLTIYISELLQMIIAAVCVGWSSGFQLPMIGLAAFMFLMEYMFRSIGIPFIPALPLGIIDGLAYSAVFVAFSHKQGMLDVKLSKVNQIQTLWGVLILAALIVGMYLMIRMTNDSEVELSNEAQTDRLTDLYNRAGYDRICSQTDIKTTALLIIDTDKFKGVNDRYGHETGDRVLKKIAWELKKTFRRSDSVCRIGGDEFAVLMVDIDKVEEKSIVDKIAGINRELASTSNLDIPHVSISVGVAHGSEAEDWTELYKNADSVLYQVKKEGGRGCHFYHRTAEDGSVQG